MAKLQGDQPEISEVIQADNVRRSSGISVFLGIVSLCASFGLILWSFHFAFRNIVLGFTDYSPVMTRNEAINEFAWSLISLSILSALPMLLAIILGHRDLRNARRNHLRQGESIAGLILGYLALPFSVFMVYSAVNMMLTFLNHPTT